MPFLSSVAIERHYLALPEFWCVTKPLVYEGAWEMLEVPAGFRTDGASIPAIFWPIVGHPLTGDHAAAAILHDCLYRQGRVSRADADGIFRRALRESGVPGWRRRLLWLAVRLFGRRRFKR